MEKKYSVDIDIKEIAKNRDNLGRFLVSIDVLEQYPTLCNFAIGKIERDFKSIGPKYLEKLSFDYQERIKRIKDSVELNMKFISEILKLYKPEPCYWFALNLDEMRQIYRLDASKILDSLYYIIRDWTSERANERGSSYNIIIQEITKYFKPNTENYKFLVPGVGLNRLGYEICQLGFDVESNDYLYLNAIFCDYILNHLKKKNQSSTVVLEKECFNSRITEDSIFYKYSFPDVDINFNEENKGKLSMTVGNFVKLYENKKDLYDCVVTCFFIDTAQNILEYVDIIYNVLKKGGIWINFGPLSYHWTEVKTVMSIELPYDMLKKSICNFGFEYIHEEIKMAPYCEIQDSLRNEIYKCVLFTVKKK